MYSKLVAVFAVVLIAVSCKDRENDHEKTISPTEIIESGGKQDTIDKLLKVKIPVPHQLISSPQKLEGQARGYWYFEGNAQVELLDGNKNTLTETYIEATDHWMTEDWVPFKGNIKFPEPATEDGYVIFHRANPSGLEENAMSDTIKVRFPASQQD